MKYTAISIGPIYKTIQQAKSTKAFWAASYLFSYIMKNMLREMNQPVEKYTTPYFDKNDLSNDHFPKTGLFHDQFIVEGEHDVQAVFDKVITKLANDIAEDIKKDTSEVRNYCKAYFNIHIISGIDLKDAEFTSSVTDSIAPFLATAELTNRVNPFENATYLQEFLEKRPNKDQPGSNYNFLHRKAFPSKRKFPSTAEIATEELKTKKELFYATAVSEYLKSDEKTDQTQFYEVVRKELEKRPSSEYRKYLKHYAIVEADGDSFGAFIEKLASLDKSNEEKHLQNGQSLMDRFSKNTMEFSQAVTGLINEGSHLSKDDDNIEKETSLKMRGHAVYAGGDDLLFFAPIAFSTFDDEGNLIDQETIFDLIEAIDEVFDHYFTNDAVFKPIIKESDFRVSMSYGVAVSYYKFPLAEAKEISHIALVDVAKKTPKKEPIKNRIVFEFRGHSGDKFSLNLHKGESGEIYKAFRALCHSVINDSNYINSLMPTLEKNIGTFQGIGFGDESDSEPNDRKWDFFFKENFNEAVHTTGSGENKELIPFLENLKSLFKIVYKEEIIGSSDESIKKNEDNWRMIYSMLKFISFIHNKDN